MLAAGLCSQVFGAEIQAVPSHPSHATEADVTVMAGELCSCSAFVGWGSPSSSPPALGSPDGSLQTAFFGKETPSARFHCGHWKTYLNKTT